MGSEEINNYHLRAKLINELLLKYPDYEDLDFHRYTLDHLKELLASLANKRS